MKKNIQHDLILSLILQEIRELRKDVELIKLHYEPVVLDDSVFLPIWYKEQNEKIQETLYTQNIIDDYVKEHGGSCAANNEYLGMVGKLCNFFSNGKVK